MRIRVDAVRPLTYLMAVVVLLAPAIWNRFPLLQWDTGGYLARWFEGYLVPSRSSVYGLFLASGITSNFWSVIVVQAAATAWIIALVARVHGFRNPLAPLAAIVLLAATTSLSFNASILLTDIFAGLSVLALHVLLFADDGLKPFERPALVLFIAFSAATHSATLAVLLGLMLVALLTHLVRRDLIATANLARGAAALVAGAAMLLAANFALSGRIAWTPGGYGILFGRMLQDGIVARYLNEHCPDTRLKLCPYRETLPRDADAFLWGTSVFDDLGRFVGLGDEMRTIVLESLADYPLMQVKTAIVDTAVQIASIRSGEGVLDTIWHTYGIMERYTPSVVPEMRAARQQHHEIGFQAINRIHVPVALGSMLLLPIIILLGFRRRRFTDFALLATTTSLAILGNAVVCGALSDPHDRYGARMVWITTFAVLLVAARLPYPAAMRKSGTPSEALADGV